MERRKENRAKTEVEHALQRQDIENLTNKMVEGFQGIHERQDTTNGKVLKSAEDIIALKSDMSFYKGGLAVLTILVVPVVIYIITHFK